ncbi:hypothetical protein V1264_024708 [Littorina saxatilis]|uniref:C1q domain-containing protein n=1 Tax=Littorina saxatilis TaxID=31220 RepID=A0AAN9AMU5_9CAEN
MKKKSNALPFLISKHLCVAVLLNQTVSFHARLNSNINVPVGSTLILPILLNNHGNAYDGSTGKFTAPYTATYCFLATTEDFINGPRSVMALVVDGKEVDYVETDGPSYGQSASVHAVLRLTVGQKVWLNVPKDNNYFGAHSTAFSGFLVDHSQ